MLSLQIRPLPNPAVVGQVVGREAVLLLSEQGEIKVINEVGARIWQLADGQRSVRDIAAIIASEYEVSLLEAEKDSLDFVAALAARDIVRLPEG